MSQFAVHGWAKVELLGHGVYAGLLSEVEAFGAVLGRVDAFRADGTRHTVFFGPGSVYRLTPLPSEDEAMKAAGYRPPKPEPEPAPEIAAESLRESAIAAWHEDRANREAEGEITKRSVRDETVSEFVRNIRTRLGVTVDPNEVRYVLGDDGVEVSVEVGGVALRRMRWGSPDRPFCVAGYPNHAIGTLAELGHLLAGLAMGEPRTPPDEPMGWEELD